MPRLGCLLVLMTLLSGASATSWAYTGGPQLIEVLGVNSSSNLVYFRTIHLDESGAFGAVYHFNLAGREQGKRILESWSDPDADFSDSVQLARLARLRRHLRPLVHEAIPALPVSTELTRTMVLSPAGDSTEQFEGTVEFHWSAGVKVHLSRLSRPDCCLKDQFSIPGRTEKLYVLSCFGNPRDPIAETQIAFLVRESEQVVPALRWERDR